MLSLSISLGLGLKFGFTLTFKITLAPVPPRFITSFLFSRLWSLGSFHVHGGIRRKEGQPDGPSGRLSLLKAPAVLNHSIHRASLVKHICDNQAPSWPKQPGRILDAVPPHRRFLTLRHFPLIEPRG